MDPKVLLAVSEAYPLVKTGGLGDAVISLARALRAGGSDARMVIPAYREVLDMLGDGRRSVACLAAADNGALFDVHRALVPGTDVPVYLVEPREGLFDRTGDPYSGPDGQDWPDNPQRFAAFGRGTAALAGFTDSDGWRAEVVHCNDWHTGVAPALLAGARPRPALVYCMHTLAYQGLFPASVFAELALPDRLWSPDGMEFHGHLSFIKGGLSYADRLVTVSPNYAREILTPQFGHGLEGLLRHRVARLDGILNGVDYEVWDPRRDPHIGQHYWIDAFAGKHANKRALQRELGLREDDEAFIVAHIGRLTAQKGTDLILDALAGMTRLGGLQMVFLGRGESRFEEALQAAAAEHPGVVAAHVGYAEALAHRIEAGADAFLMPSRFEPCGLSQLYSLRYGAVPIVRATGGLVDTVRDAGVGRTPRDGATGMVFAGDRAMLATVRRAHTLFRQDRHAWRMLMVNGMREDFSWAQSVARYREVYARALEQSRIDSAGVATARN